MTGKSRSPQKAGNGVILNTAVTRNIKLFFKDKGMFFTSLITPLILLVLYATFLADVYRDSFRYNIPEGFEVSDALIDGCVAAELFSSLLAVCCVTVAFCSNFLMVQDKVNKSYDDLTIAPVRGSLLAVGYYAASALSTLIISVTATAVCFVYIACVGWFFGVTDILLIFLDIFLLVMFGTALSSIINIFLTSQGQISAVGTVVSAGYGFLCGAYMPISQFADTVQKIIMFLPGTYGTALLRRHSMNGVFDEMRAIGINEETVNGIMDSVDCNLYFFGESVSESTMYAVLGGTVVLLVALYVILNYLHSRKKA